MHWVVGCWHVPLCNWRILLNFRYWSSCPALKCRQTWLESMGIFEKLQFYKKISVASFAKIFAFYLGRENLSCEISASNSNIVGKYCICNYFIIVMHLLMGMWADSLSKNICYLLPWQTCLLIYLIPEVLLKSWFQILGFLVSVIKAPANGVRDTPSGCLWTLSYLQNSEWKPGSFAYWILHHHTGGQAPTST